MYTEAYPDADLTIDKMEKNNEAALDNIDNIYFSHIQNVPPFKTKVGSSSKGNLDQPINSDK